jgi:hypothetical protein
MASYASPGFFSPERLNQHRWEMTDEQIVSSFGDSLYLDLIDDRAFRRLRSISFLGAIDYVLPNNTSIRKAAKTRYHHSLGVACLGLQFAQQTDASEKDTRLIVSAALLHDIGHAPLSHSLESVFSTHFGLSHHEAGTDVIKGESPLGAGIYKILKAKGIEPDEVIALIEGKHFKHFNHLFRSPMNIDTFDGILRSRYYMKLSGSLSPSALVESFVELDKRSTQRFDQFWKAKHDIYGYLINSASGVLADALARKYVIHNLSAFSPSDYFATERNLFLKHPVLHDSLKTARALLKASARRDIEYRQRNFFLDADVIVGSYEDLYKRYLQNKTVARIQIPESLVTGPQSEQKLLFESICDESNRRSQGIL